MIHYIWSQGAFWSLGLAAAASGVVGVAHALTRRNGWFNAAIAALVSLSMLVIVTMTLARYGFPRAFRPSAGFHWTANGWRRFTTTLGHSDEIGLNIALYVPPGLVVALKVQRPVVVLGGLLTLSCCVEVLQGVFALGIPDISDLASNFLGAYLGVVVASAILMVRGTRRRTIGLQLIALVALFALLGACVPVLAAHRQSDVAAKVRARFQGDTLTDIHAWASDGSIGEKVFNLEDTFSNGAIDAPGQISVRYPTSFLGIDQCVYAIWTRSGVRVSTKRGAACSAFLG